MCQLRWRSSTARGSPSCATTTYFVGRESVVATELEGMPLALEHLYSLLHRVQTAPPGSSISPVDSIFEVGAQVEI
jgi:K+ transporter